MASISPWTAVVPTGVVLVGPSEPLGVVAVFVLGVAAMALAATGWLVWYRVWWDREAAASATTSTSTGTGSLGPVRFTGGAIIAVDGRRRQGSAELVLDATQATIRVRSRPGTPRMVWERVVHRDDVETIVRSRWRPVPYVEFVDDVRTHGITRFTGGPNLVRALRDRGWPVPDDPAEPPPDDAETGGGPPCS